MKIEDQYRCIICSEIHSDTEHEADLSNIMFIMRDSEIDDRQTTLTLWEKLVDLLFKRK